MLPPPLCIVLLFLMIALNVKLNLFSDMLHNLYHASQYFLHAALAVGAVQLLFISQSDAFAVFRCERWNCPCAGDVTRRQESPPEMWTEKRSLMEHAEETRKLTEKILGNIVSHT